MWDTVCARRILSAIVVVAALLFASDASSQAAGSAAPSAAPARGAPGTVPLHIRVRGTAELHAVATADHGDLTVHGELIDDAGTPIAGVPIAIEATAADDPRAPKLRVGPLRPCDDARGPAAARRA